MKTGAIESDCDVLVCDKYMINILSATKCRPMILVSRNIKYNTPVTPGLRPYCDQFFDQIALDRSKVSLRSHYGLSVVAVGRTSRCMVVLVVLVAVRNFGMFKIPYCDFSIAVQSGCCQLSVCTRTARTVVTVRSPNAALHSHAALTAHDL